MDKAQELRWGVERRLEFIEFRLFWDGAINRADLVKFFGVSVPQASKDLSLYQERAPGNLEYDKSEKRYFAATKFKPRFLNPDPDVYLSQLKSASDGAAIQGECWIANPPDTDIALTPKRDIDIEVLRNILRAVRENSSVEVLYQSMNKARPDPIWRRITPHAFGFDGFRWHARAYCHLQRKFKDFLLPRMLGSRSLGDADVLGKEDALWHEHFDVIICPHPDLTDSQKAVVAKDYGFTDGEGVLSVRYAMLFYVLKRMGLLDDPENKDARTQHIIVSNKVETKSALERLNYSKDVGLFEESSISA